MKSNLFAVLLLLGAATLTTENKFASAIKIKDDDLDSIVGAGAALTRAKRRAALEEADDAMSTAAEVVKDIVKPKKSQEKVAEKVVEKIEKKKNKK